MGDMTLIGAEQLHFIRSKLTSMVHEKIDKSIIDTIDVLIDCTKNENINFAFKINIPKEKIENAILEEG